MLLHPVPCTASHAYTSSSIFFQAFDGPFFRHLFKNTPDSHIWHSETTKQEMTDERSRFLMIEDDAVGSTLDSNNNNINDRATNDNSLGASSDVEIDDPRIAAFAKWVVPVDGKSVVDTDWVADWPASTDQALAERFFVGLMKRREAIMGVGRITVLGTRPSYQGQGAGSKLIKWGLDQADKEGLEAYIEASPKGMPLYQKFGWEHVENYDITYGPEQTMYRTVLMLRKPKTPV